VRDEVALIDSGCSKDRRVKGQCKNKGALGMAVVVAVAASAVAVLVKRIRW
jgi:hypothetical protein